MGKRLERSNATGDVHVIALVILSGYLLGVVATSLHVGIYLARRTGNYVDHDIDLLVAVMAGAFWPVGWPIYRLYIILKAEQEQAEQDRMAGEKARRGY